MCRINEKFIGNKEKLPVTSIVREYWLSDTSIAVIVAVVEQHDDK